MDALVTYDIDTSDSAGERRLARVAKVCESYGIRVQKSVFECRLHPAGMEWFISELLEVMDPRVDSINIYPFPGSVSETRRSLGRTPIVDPRGPWIV
jgi:CRISPR-associated protein Cas2